MGEAKTSRQRSRLVTRRHELLGFGSPRVLRFSPSSIVTVFVKRRLVRLLHAPPSQRTSRDGEKERQKNNEVIDTNDRSAES